VRDPACTTASTLRTAMNHVIGKWRDTERRKWKKPDNPSERAQTELFRKIQDFADHNIVGIDINPNLVKATKMNMVMNNDGAGGLYQANSLDRPVMWGKELRERDLMGYADIVFTNPPFGSKIPIDDPAILEQFDLAPAW